MTPVLSLAVGLLAGVGVYLVLARRVFPVIVGFSLLTHAANLVMLSAGDWGEKAPIIVDGVQRRVMADPVPQALVLTAIVISMSVTLYLLATFAASARVLDTEEVMPALAGDEEGHEASVPVELAGRGRGQV